MSRQTQRGRGFGKEVRGPLTHREEQYVPLISDLDTVAQPGAAPPQGPHWLHSQDMSQTHIHTHTHTYALPPHSLNLTDIPDRTTRVSVGGDQAPLLPPKGRPVI
jgi:hypothetical protein